MITFSMLGQDFFHCLDIDPLTDDVFRLAIFFQGLQKSIGFSLRPSDAGLCVPLCLIHDLVRFHPWLSE